MVKTLPDIFNETSVAIQNKLGIRKPLEPTEFAEKINSISSGITEVSYLPHPDEADEHIIYKLTSDSTYYVVNDGVWFNLDELEEPDTEEKLTLLINYGEDYLDSIVCEVNGEEVVAQYINQGPFLYNWGKHLYMLSNLPKNCTITIQVILNSGASINTAALLTSNEPEYLEFTSDYPAISCTINNLTENGYLLLDYIEWPE